MRFGFRDSALSLGGALFKGRFEVEGGAA